MAGKALVCSQHIANKKAEYQRLVMRAAPRLRLLITMEALKHLGEDPARAIDNPPNTKNVGSRKINVLSIVAAKLTRLVPYSYAYHLRGPAWAYPSPHFSHGSDRNRSLLSESLKYGSDGAGLQ